MKRSIPLYEHPSVDGFETASSGPYVLDGFLSWLGELRFRLNARFCSESSRVMPVVERTLIDGGEHYAEVAAARVANHLSEYRVTLETPCEHTADIRLFVEHDRVLIDAGGGTRHRAGACAASRERRVHSFRLPKRCDDTNIEAYVSGRVLTIFVGKIGRRTRKAHILAMVHESRALGLGRVAA